MADKFDDLSAVVRWQGVVSAARFIARDHMLGKFAEVGGGLDAPARESGADIADPSDKVELWLAVREELTNNNWTGAYPYLDGALDRFRALPPAVRVLDARVLSWFIAHAYMARQIVRNAGGSRLKSKGLSGADADEQEKLLLAVDAAFTRRRWTSGYPNLRTVLARQEDLKDLLEGRDLNFRAEAIAQAHMDRVGSHQVYGPGGAFGRLSGDEQRESVSAGGAEFGGSGLVGDGLDAGTVAQEYDGLPPVVREQGLVGAGLEAPAKAIAQPRIVEQRGEGNAGSSSMVQGPGANPWYPSPADGNKLWSEVRTELIDRGWGEKPLPDFRFVAVKFGQLEASVRGAGLDVQAKAIAHEWMIRGYDDVASPETKRMRWAVLDKLKGDSWVGRFPPLGHVARRHRTLDASVRAKEFGVRVAAIAQDWATDRNGHGRFEGSGAQLQQSLPAAPAPATSAAGPPPGTRRIPVRPVSDGDGRGAPHLSAPLPDGESGTLGAGPADVTASRASGMDMDTDMDGDGDLGDGQLQEWYEKLAGLEYMDSQGNLRGLPYDVPEGGDPLRAHHMALSLLRLGAGARVRMISVAQASGLTFRSHNGAGVANRETGVVNVPYRIVPAVVRALSDDSVEVAAVFDPVLGRGPLSEQEWLAAVHVERAVRRFEGESFAEVQGILGREAKENPEKWDARYFERGLPNDPVVVISEVFTPWFPFPFPGRSRDGYLGGDGYLPRPPNGDGFFVSLEATRAYFRGQLAELDRVAAEGVRRAKTRGLLDSVRAGKVTPEQARAMRVRLEPGKRPLDARLAKALAPLLQGAAVGAPGPGPESGAVIEVLSDAEQEDLWLAVRTELARIPWLGTYPSPAAVTLWRGYPSHSVRGQGRDAQAKAIADAYAKDPGNLQRRELKLKDPEGRKATDDERKLLSEAYSELANNRWRGRYYPSLESVLEKQRSLSRRVQSQHYKVRARVVAWSFMAGAGGFGLRSSDRQTSEGTGYLSDNEQRDLMSVFMAVLKGVGWEDTPPDNANVVARYWGLKEDIRGWGLDAAARVVAWTLMRGELDEGRGGFAPGVEDEAGRAAERPSAAGPEPEEDGTDYSQAENRIGLEAGPSRAERVQRVRAAVGEVVPRLLSREQLVEVVRGVVRRGPAPSPSGESTVERCAELVRGLRDELFPQGVRGAEILDDAAVGGSGWEGVMAAGPGWRLVDRDTDVVAGVEGAGAGSVAFVLAGRPGDQVGHAWAAYHLGDEDGVTWVDLENPEEESRVSGVAPDVAWLETRAVVVGPEGMVMPDVLSSFVPSTSTPRTLPDASTNRLYGAGRSGGSSSGWPAPAPAPAPELGAVGGDVEMAEAGAVAGPEQDGGRRVRPTSEGALAPAQAPAPDPAAIPALVANVGRGYRGFPGGVYPMPLPEPMLEWVRAFVTRAVMSKAVEEQGAGEGRSGGRDPEAPDPRAVEALAAQVAAEFSQPALYDDRTYVQSQKGMIRTLTYLGRRYRVAVRRELIDAQPAPGMASEGPEGRQVHTESRIRSTLRNSDISSQETAQTIVLTYLIIALSLLLGESAMVLFLLGFRLKAMLVHNRESIKWTVRNDITVMTALDFSSESSRAYRYGTTWQADVLPLDGPGTGPTLALTTTTTAAAATNGNWDGAVTGTAPGWLALWFPHYLTQDPEPLPPGEVPARERPADGRVLAATELSLIHMHTVHDPHALHDTIVAAPELHPYLRRMSPDSASDLKVFLSEANERGMFPLALAGAGMSPVLYDRAMDPLGYLVLFVRSIRLNPEVLAKSKNLVTESTLQYVTGVENAYQVTNAVQTGFSVPLTFQDSGAPGVGGSATFSGSHQYERGRVLNSGGVAYDWFGLVSENPQLLVGAEVEYGTYFVSSEGGTSDTHVFRPPEGYGLRVPSQADIDGVDPEESRYLSWELAELRGLPASANPLRITDGEEQLDQAETALRGQGFLPPAEPRSLLWMPEVERTKLLQAQTENSKKLRLLRTQIGQRAGLKEMMGAGHATYFERPFGTSVWRVSLELSVAARPGTSPHHRKNLPGWAALNANGMSAPGGASYASSHTWSFAYSGEAHGPVSEETAMQGGLPSGLSWSRQRGKASGSASGVGLDMFQYAQNGLALYDIPAVRTLAMFSDGDPRPLAVFEPANVTVTLTYPLAATLGTPPAPLPAPTIRAATEEDYRLARMAPDDEGNRPQEAVLLPASAHVELALGSAELVKVYQWFLANDDLAGAFRRFLEGERSGRVASEPEVHDETGEAVEAFRRFLWGSWAKGRSGPVTDAIRGESAEARAGLVHEFRQFLEAEGPSGVVSELTDVVAEPTGAGTDVAVEPTGAGSGSPDAREELVVVFGRFLDSGLLGSRPEASALGQVMNWTAEQGARVGRIGTALPALVTGAGQWLKDVTFGKSLAGAATFAQEVGRTSLSSTALQGRDHQIMRGVHAFEAGGDGSVVGTEIKVEVRGYPKDLVYVGTDMPPAEGIDGVKPTRAIESDVTATDSALKSTSFSHTTEYGFSGSLTGTAGSGAVTITGSGGQSRSVSGSETNATVVTNNRLNVDARETHHGFRATGVYLLKLSRAYSNAPANSVGIGAAGTEDVAVEVPGGQVFWVPETDVRQDRRLAELAGLPYAEPRLDRLPPPSFVRSGGESVGTMTVPDVVPDGALDEIFTTIRTLVEREAPGALTTGGGSRVRGLDSRIGDEGMVVALRAAIGAGARKWRRPITFVYRGWGSLYLIQVAVRARPARGVRLADVRGALRTKSGVEHQLSSALSSVTRTAGRSGTVSLGLSGSGGPAGAAASLSSTGSGSRSQADSQHRQQWERVGAPSAQFTVPYELEYAVISERLTDSLPSFLINTVVSPQELAETLKRSALSLSEAIGVTELIAGMAEGVTGELARWREQALSRISAIRSRGPVLPTTTSDADIPLGPLAALPAQGADEAARETVISESESGTEWEPPVGTPVATSNVTATLRFPAEETPYVRPDGTVDWPAPPTLLQPGIHTTDPRETRELPALPVDPFPHAATPAVPDADAATAPHPLDRARRWMPRQVVVVTHVDATDEIADALRAVDPALRDTRLGKASDSQEATLLRIGDAVGAGEVELSAVQASKLAGLETASDSSVVVELMLYRPQLETPRRAVHRMGMNTAIRSALSSSSQTQTAVVNVPLTHLLTDDGTHTLGGTLPAVGGSTTTGRSSGVTSNHREIISYGTSVSQNEAGEPDDSGVLAFTLTTHIVMKITGPDGTRWALGNAVVGATLEDTLGWGIAPPRPSPNVYDLPAMLAGQSQAHLRDWARHPVSELPRVLADGFHPDDATPQLWIALGERRDPELLARAIFVASRTAVVAGRPVELVVSTDGSKHWTFDADGELTGLTGPYAEAAGTDWAALRGAIETYLRARQDERAGRAAESRLRQRLRDARTARDAAQPVHETAEREHGAADRSHAEARGSADALRTELGTVRDDIHRLDAEVARLADAARAARDRLAATPPDQPATREEHARAVEAADRDVKEATAEYAAFREREHGLVADVEQAETAVRWAGEAQQKAADELTRATAALDASRTRTNETKEELAALRREAAEHANSYLNAWRSLPALTRRLDRAGAAGRHKSVLTAAPAQQSAPADWSRTGPPALTTAEPPASSITQAVHPHAVRLPADQGARDARIAELRAQARAQAAGRQQTRAVEGGAPSAGPPLRLVADLDGGGGATADAFLRSARSLAVSTGEPVDLALVHYDGTTPDRLEHQLIDPGHARHADAERSHAEHRALEAERAPRQEAVERSLAALEDVVAEAGPDIEAARAAGAALADAERDDPRDLDRLRADARLAADLAEELAAELERSAAAAGPDVPPEWSRVAAAATEAVEAAEAANQEVADRQSLLDRYEEADRRGTAAQAAITEALGRLEADEARVAEIGTAAVRAAEAHRASGQDALREGAAATAAAERRSGLSDRTPAEAVRTAWQTTASGYALPDDDTELATAQQLSALPGARTLALGAPGTDGGYAIRGRAMTTAELAEQIAARLTADGEQPPRRLVLHAPGSAALARELSTRLGRLVPHPVDVVGAHGDPSPAVSAAGRIRQAADRFVAPARSGWAAYRGGEPVATGLLAPRTSLPDLLKELAKPKHAATATPESVLVVREVRGAGGRIAAVGLFDEGDWEVRRGAYARLGEVSEYTSWGRDADGKRVASRRVLPGGGGPGGTVFFASHDGDAESGLGAGSPAAEVLRRAVKEGAASSVTSVVCVRGSGSESVERARARAQLIADTAGVTAYVLVGRAAVTPGRAGGLPAVHLLGDEQGRATDFVAAYPAGGGPPRVWEAEESADVGRSDEAYPDVRFVNAGEAFGDALESSGHPAAQSAPGGARSVGTASASAAGYQRTGSHTAKLDGYVYTLRELGKFGWGVDLLHAALWKAVPELLVAVGADLADGFRRIVARDVVEDDLSSVTVPELHAHPRLSTGLLKSIGADTNLTAVQRIEGELAALAPAEVRLNPLDRLRVMIAAPFDGEEGSRIPLAALVAPASRALGVGIALVDPQGEVASYGVPSREARPVLIVRDDDGDRVGVPGEPGGASEEAPEPGAHPSDEDTDEDTDDDTTEGRDPSIPSGKRDAGAADGSRSASQTGWDGSFTGSGSGTAPAYIEGDVSESELSRYSDSEFEPDSDDDDSSDGSANDPAPRLSDRPQLMADLTNDRGETETVPVGRNLTSQAVIWVTAGQRCHHKTRDGVPRITKYSSAPWGELAYMLAVDVDDHGNLLDNDDRPMDLPSLVRRVASDDVLAELDARAGQKVPVVLVTPFGAAGFYSPAQMHADQMDRSVWAHTRIGRLVADDSGVHIPATLDRDPDLPYGDWARIEPRLERRLPPADRWFTALDGTRFRASQVDTRLLVAPRGESFGRESTEEMHEDRDSEWKLRGYRDHMALDHVTKTTRHDRQLLYREVYPSPPAILAFSAHGNAGLVWLAIHIDGAAKEKAVRAKEGARFVASLPEFAEARAKLARGELPPDFKVRFPVCYGATAGHHSETLEPTPHGPPGVRPVDDPLDTVSFVQHFINVTGLPAEASILKAYGSDRVAHSPDGRGGLATPRREPTREELATLARRAGLHRRAGRVPPTVLKRTLRLVRALRQVFGDDVEDDPSTFDKLLTGIGALERLRANDEKLNRLTPFRMEMWNLLARQMDRSDPDRDPEKAAYRKVLDAAREQVAADPNARLSANPGPRLGEGPVASLLRDAITRLDELGDDLVRKTLDIEDNSVRVRRAQRARALWARVGSGLALSELPGDEAEVLARQVLHGAFDRPHEKARQRRALRQLMTRALAADWDVRDDDALGAFDLRTRGAFDQSLRIGTRDESQGINWSGGQFPHGVKTSRLWVDRPDGSARQQKRPPWRETDFQHAYVVTLDRDARPDRLLMHLPGGEVHATEGEILALLRANPDRKAVARRGDSRMPVAVLVTGRGGGAMPELQRFSDYSGSDTHLWTGEAALLPSPRPGLAHRIVLRPQHDATAGRFESTTWTPPTEYGPFAATASASSAVSAFALGGAEAFFGQQAVSPGAEGSSAPDGSGTLPPGGTHAYVLPEPVLTAAPSAGTLAQPETEGPSAAAGSPAPPGVDPTTHPLLADYTSVTGPASGWQGRSWLTDTQVKHVLPGKMRRFVSENGRLRQAASVPGMAISWPDSAIVIAAAKADRRGLLLGGWTLNGHRLPVRLEDHPDLAHLPRDPETGFRIMAPSALADVLRADPSLAEQPKDAPLVLAIPHAGVVNMEFARALADALGRRVWIPTSDWGLHPDGTGQGHLLGLVDPEGDTPVGGWVPIDPKPDRLRRTPLRLKDLDSSFEFWDADLHRRPWVDDDPKWSGTSFMPDSDLGRGREARCRMLAALTELHHYARSGEKGGLYMITSQLVDLPPRLFALNVHGFRGGAQFTTYWGQIVHLAAREAGQVLGTLAEVADQPPDVWLYLNACSGATPGDPMWRIRGSALVPPVDDSLRERPLGHWLAAASRRGVLAYTSITGIWGGALQAEATAAGRLGQIVLFKPPPVRAELAELARKADLYSDHGPVPKEILETTDVLVYALQLRFRHVVEDDPVEYEKKLRGIAALEKMRANDSQLASVTPFRLDLWTYIARVVAGPTVDLTLDRYLAVLEKAQQRLDAKPDIKLTEAFPDPALQAVLTRWQDGSVDHRAREVLGLATSPLPLSAAKIARAFWAAARTEHELSGKPQIDPQASGPATLHLDVKLSPGEWREKLAELMSQTDAAGRVSRTGFEHPSFDLERRGAFKQLWRAPDGTAHGYGWGGTPLPQGIDMTQVFWEEQQAGGGTVVRAEAAPWPRKDHSGKALPVYGIHLEVSSDGRRVMHLPGAAVPVADGEFRELLRNAPLERDLELEARIVFLISGLGSSGLRLVQQHSNFTARSGWAFTGDIRLRENPRGPRQILLLPEAGTGNPGVWKSTNWRVPKAVPPPPPLQLPAHVRHQLGTS
ncbi:lonely Cys domain-containing protein [Streptomyces sp. NPDC051954]|uniref:lonely Cys domain-containing protein n=1 Tax=Streptomyces sp. NPDC051954 TaxID=3155524 RepID=UPI00344A46F4